MITAEMTDAEKVVEFLRMHPGAWYCGGCVTVSTAVEPSKVGQITRPLALKPGYDGAFSVQCARCGQLRKCIRLRATRT